MHGMFVDIERFCLTVNVTSFDFLLSKNFLRVFSLCKYKKNT